MSVPGHWTRSGDPYDAMWGEDVTILVALHDHRWVASVAFRKELVHVSEHGGQDEAFEAAKDAVKRALHLRRFGVPAPARPKPDAAPEHPYR